MAPENRSFTLINVETTKGTNEVICYFDDDMHEKLSQARSQGIQYQPSNADGQLCTLIRYQFRTPTTAQPKVTSGKYFYC